MGVEERVVGRLAKLVWGRGRLEQVEGARRMRERMGELVGRVDGQVGAGGAREERDPFGWLDGEALDGGILGESATPLGVFLREGDLVWGADEVAVIARLFPKYMRGDQCWLIDDFGAMWAWEKALKEVFGGGLEVGGVVGWLGCIRRVSMVVRLAMVVGVRALISSYKNSDILKIQQFIRDISHTLEARSAALLALRALKLTDLFNAEFLIFVSNTDQKRVLSAHIGALQSWAKYSGL